MTSPVRAQNEITQINYKHLGVMLPLPLRKHANITNSYQHVLPDLSDIITCEAAVEADKPCPRWVGL